MSVEKYRKKPVEIEAVQWDGTAAGATPVIDWILSHGGSARFRDNPPMMHDIACQCDGRGVIPGGHLTADLIPCPETEPTGGKPPDIAIGTLEGTMTASPGDWIIRGVQGEFYPCKPDIFAATYESPAGKVFDVPGGVDWFDVCVQLRENNAFLTDDDCKAAASLIEAVLRARGEWPYV